LGVPHSVRAVPTVKGSSPELERSKDDELPSEGIVTGAVQVPGSGQPLVFLADHPVTGGYPVAAVVVRADLWKCVQLRPGDHVRFQIGSGRPSRGPSPSGSSPPGG
jgi:allophanate hydrolase subunit 2